MFFRTFTKNKSMASGASHENKSEVNDYEANNNDQDDENQDNEEYEEDKVKEAVEALLIPSGQEKKALLASFDAMRREALFCDVAFNCQGVLYRAHRVVVSSWGRWMRTFLMDSPEEEMLSLDLFQPDALKGILDYMYGQPLQVTVENADGLLKVVRRLEMHKLEQQIWRYLITVLDEETNCEYLHELADRYDCPPLKLATWRLLKEKMPGMNNSSFFPTRKQLLKFAKLKKEDLLGGTGLTGPGNIFFNPLATIHMEALERYKKSKGGGGGAGGKKEMKIGGGNNKENGGGGDGLLNNMPSVFDDLDENNNYNDDEDEDEEEGEDYEQDYEDLGYDDYGNPVRRRKRGRGGGQGGVPRLEELAKNAQATVVIQAWAQRLKEIYTSCVPVDAFSDNGGGGGNDYLGGRDDYDQGQEDEDAMLDRLRLDDDTPNVRLNRVPMTTQQSMRAGGGGRGGGGDRSDLLGGQPTPPLTPVLQRSNTTRGGQGGGRSPSPLERSATSRSVMPPPSPSSRKDNNNNPVNGMEGKDVLLLGKNRIVPSSPPKVKLVKGMKTIDWEAELTEFYQVINIPEKSAGIPTILAAWQGKEEIMLQNLVKKYEARIPKKYMPHLERINQFLENQTDVSVKGGGGGGGGQQQSAKRSGNHGKNI